MLSPTGELGGAKFTLIKCKNFNCWEMHKLPTLSRHVPFYRLVRMLSIPGSPADVWLWICTVTAWSECYGLFTPDHLQVLESVNQLS